MSELVREGKNCWRVAQANRAAFVVDGEAYFRAVYESISRAQRTIFLLGWDIHSKLELLRGDGGAKNGSTLADVLDRVTEERPDLHVYVLSWDFAMIYAMEREFFPRYKLGWKSHDRVHFCLDGEHPVGASQHQKIVVVDDRVAFCGGIDLSQWRWDTSEHRVDDERRKDPQGTAYPPFHDVQLAVDGEAAEALGKVARERWERVSDTEPKERVDTASDPWPSSVTPDLEVVDVAIARTLPPYGDAPEVREVEQLYLDSIEAAKRFIYVENQYLTSARVGEALAARLAEEDGPELVVVGPEETGGWLEQHTMDVLRARMLRRLREADQHDRLRVYYARLSAEPHVSLMVHAKVMVIDDTFVRVGSSNLSNRSMGLDSECDLAIDGASSEGHREAIRAFRQRLLAEHLGVSTDALVHADDGSPSLIDAIESLRDGERTLEPLDGEVPPEVDELVPSASVIDPEKPIEPEDLLGSFVEPENQRPNRHGFAKILAVAGAVLVLAGLWRWTPLGEWLSVERLTEVGEWMKGRPLTPLYLLGAYVVAGVAVVPVTLLFIATVIVFGPWVGMAYAVVGAELAALAGFGVGRMLGRDTVRRIAGSSVNRISRKLSERGILATITLRIVPIAPFTVINIVAGISDVKLRDFAIGNLIGVLPGILAAAFLTDRIVASLREPSTGTVALVLVAVVAVAAGIYVLRRLLRRKSESE